MSDVKAKAANAAVVSGPVDFDKLGGEEVYFDRPIATFRKIPHNTIVGKLVQKVWLQKPDDARGIVEVDENDPHSNEWACYVIHLTHACKAVEGDAIVDVPAGREVYLPATAKIKDLSQFLGRKEMFTVAVKDNEIQPLKGGFMMQKYRVKVLGFEERKGYFLIGGPDAAQLAAGAAAPALGAGINGQTAAAPMPLGSVPLQA